MSNGVTTKILRRFLGTFQFKTFLLCYVVRSCSLSCFHSYPRLKLTFTIIAMQKSRSHPPFILYEDCLTKRADLRELDYNAVACTRKHILRLPSGLCFYPSTVRLLCSNCCQIYFALFSVLLLSEV